MKCFLAAVALVAISPVAQSQGQSPFAPPRAKLHYAPDRTCDLTHLEVVLDVDYPARKVTGHTVNSLTPLRNGLREVVLHAGAPANVEKVSVDGRVVEFHRDGINLIVATGPIQKGKPLKIRVNYSCENAKGTGFGSGGGGWHWISPNQQNPDRVGFWTQGQSIYNNEWAPTWDYPNDLATSQVTCTVQADWDVVGNGKLVSTQLSRDKKRKTVVWRMDQPHATYLLSLCGGLFDIKRDKWRDKDLWYVVPKGLGTTIDSSFGHTKDMLDFFTKVLNVEYPWPKYAQNAMYDFGGGMENVTATTLGEGSLTESRDGFFEMDSLNSHELAHQWFGDLVTCKDWGDTWLNESFATFMQTLYFEHSRGKDAYNLEINGAMRDYFQEARRYRRPISTKMYSEPDAMFDSHSYPKGGVVLHTLRRFLGDEAFFAGLNAYLTRWRHTPVESQQLCRAMTESSGINCEPFWDQWIVKPGHPVLETSWAYNAGKIKLTVKQVQDTKDGTPVYNIVSQVGLIGANGMTRQTVHLSKAEETFELPVTTQPLAVLLDPDQDFLREFVKVNWTQDECLAILAHAPNAADRASAMTRLLTEPTDAGVNAILAALRSDTAIAPALEQTSRLGNLARPELRDFWVAELSHKNFGRRAQAVTALAKLPPDAATVSKLRSLVTPESPIQVVVNVVNALKGWDAKAHRDIFEKASTIPDRRNRIKRAATSALGP